MIDLGSVVLSTVAVVFVVFRAALLDRRLPWFAPPPEPVETPRGRQSRPRAPAGRSRS